MAPITAPPQMRVAKNYEDLCVQVVQKVLSLSQKTIKARGRFTVALSGGSTPQGIYALMAKAPYGDQFDWKNIHFFLGDERWVPADSSRSNDKMIVDSLISKINIPRSNFHPVNTKTPDVQTSASLYEKELVSYFSLKPNEFPRFDLVLLGLGGDGHTASLFPNNAALEETKSLVLPVEAAGIPEKRITLTFPVINNAYAVYFLVSGPDKASMLKNVLEGEGKGVLPAGRVNPQSGRLCWFTDTAAVSLLQGKYEAC